MVIQATSSNINEVIRAVLNFLLLFFFYKKILHALKALKPLKALKALKAQKAPKSTKSTKRHKDTQAKAQKRK